MDISQDKLLWIYERMQLIRIFENRVKIEFSNGKIPGFVHLDAGEEAVAVGIYAHLTDADYMTSPHRGHGHCVAKGVDPGGMMAELFDKATGTCKGKGGSMHIADMDKGMLGANGIVGGGPPLACGSGLTAKIKETDQVTICFFGDGASEQGTLHEILNLAASWKLPIIFVAENNGYAESTPAHYHCSVENIADRAAAQHSQVLYSLFTHIPGLKTVVPATPYDAKGLLISSIRDDDLVIFFNGPIKMVTAPHTPVPFSPPLEDHYLPNAQKIATAARSLF